MPQSEEFGDWSD